MSVLVIRAHERFAVCRQVPLRKGCDCAGDGLLIEISLGGCRVSQVKHDCFSESDMVSFQIEGFGEIAGEVRWSSNNCLGLRLSRPLHQAEFQSLLELLRSRPEQAAAVGKS